MAMRVTRAIIDGVPGLRVYQHVVHRISFQHLGAMFADCFGLRVDIKELHMLKCLVASPQWWPPGQMLWRTSEVVTSCNNLTPWPIRELLLAGESDPARVASRGSGVAPT